MKYLRLITYAELCELWGFNPALTARARGRTLYIRVRKDGTVHPKGGAYVHEGEVKPEDVIYEPYSTIK